MGRKLKFFLGISYLIILSLFLYFVFSKIEISRLNDFLYYKDMQVNLNNFVGNNLYFNLVVFFLFSIIWITLLGFGLPLLVVSGILFGQWIGTLISIISITIGATILYSIAKIFFASFAENIFKSKFSKYIQLFKKNEFFYFLIYRLTGGLGVPFPLQNILPVIFNMSKVNYFLSSLLGFIPSFFIFNTIGSGINIFIKESNNFSLMNLIFTKEIYLPLIIFLILIVFSMIVKKKFFSDTYK